MPWTPDDAKTIREMIFKEGEFMNDRVTWLVTLQGLLYAALGFAWKDGKELIGVLCVVGLVVSFTAVPPLYFAHRAIRRLKHAWETKRDPNYDGPPVIGYLTDNWVERYFLSWFSLWFTLPPVFIASWIVVLCINANRP